MTQGGPTLAELMEAYDWQEAMGRCDKFRFDQIEQVLLARPGDNDGPNWLLLVELKGGGFGALSAWCDYSGWGCQDGGDSGIFETIDLAKAFLVKDTYEDDLKSGKVFAEAGL